MNRRPALVLILVLAMIGGAGTVENASGAPAPVAASHECVGIPKCISVPGPWVIVSPRGETDFLLSCPKHEGFAGGVDSLATSRSIRVTFDGLMSSPIAAGRTTSTSILFRAISANAKPGAFKPFIGCVPVNNHSAQTVSFPSTQYVAPLRFATRAPHAAPKAGASAITPAGPPLVLTVKTVTPRPGASTRVALNCPKGQRLLESWEATAFDTALPPNLALAAEVRAPLTTHGSGVSATVAADTALSKTTRPQVQFGIGCA